MSCNKFSYNFKWAHIHSHENKMNIQGVEFLLELESLILQKHRLQSVYLIRNKTN